MITITHFIPLIGPFIMGSKQIKDYDVKNEYFISLSPFKNNEQHINHNFNEINMQYMDEIDPTIKEHITAPFDKDISVYKNCVKCQGIKPTDIQLSVPPCAGLSMMNAGNRGADAAANRWMYETVKWFLAQGSKVLIFENAPGFVGAHGLKVMENINEILKHNGVENEYKMQVTKTNTVSHGIPQNRQRCFFYLYKSNSHFIFKNIKHNTPSLEEFLTLPEAEDPTIDHVTFKASWNQEDIGLIEKKNEWKFFRDLLHKDPSKPYDSVSCFPYWLEKYKQDKSYFADYPKKAKDCERVMKKMEQGLGYWDGSPNFYRGRTNAIVAKNAYNTIHPIYNRYLTIRELMTLMGYPQSFKLVDPIKNFNHICQSLPVKTGIDHIKWAIGIVTGDDNLVVKDIKIDEKVLFQNNCKADLQNEISVGNFDKWSPYTGVKKTSKLKAFVK